MRKIYKHKILYTHNCVMSIIILTNLYMPFCADVGKNSMLTF